MNNDAYYYTIEKPSLAEFKDRGSKFIAYAFPIAAVSEFKEIIAETKKKHLKAVHHCFAYRIGPEGTNFRVSDDGEPSGTAGRPILGQIDSKQLTNVLIIVVRYFGGTLLGVPGLINAYKTASALVLEAGLIIQKPHLINYRLQFAHTQTHDVMKVVKLFNCVISMQETQLFSLIEMGIPKDRLTEVLLRLKELKAVEVKKINV